MDRHVTITPTIPRGTPVAFHLIDDTTLTRSGSTAGGWQIIDRPRRSATTEWLDHSPFTLPMTLLLDGMSNQPFDSPRSVEADILRVEAWETRAAGKQQPPILRASGPIPHTDLQWVVQSLSWGAAIRHPRSGQRLQQALTMTLLEYVPATIVTARKSPAKSAQHRGDTTANPTTSPFRYTVRTGDTLTRIAVAVYGDFRKWTVIARVNSIIDPAAPLQVGRVLIIPAA